MDANSTLQLKRHSTKLLKHLTFPKNVKLEPGSWKQVEFRKLRVEEIRESRHFLDPNKTKLQFWPQQRFFAVRTEESYSIIFLGFNYFIAINDPIHSYRKRFPVSVMEVKIAQLGGNAARERRVKQRGFLFK